MALDLMFSRANTQALRGIAALMIVFFHVVWGYGISPLLNMWGAFFVTIFIILSGYGLEESFRTRGLDGYWRKRVEKVVLPVAFLIMASIISCWFSFLRMSPSIQDFLSRQ